MKFEYRSPSKQRQQAVFNHVVMGMGKERATLKAGLSIHTTDKIFDNHRVRAYKEHWKKMESELPPDKLELIAYYRSIINSPVTGVFYKRVKKYAPLKRQLKSSFEEGASENPTMVIVGEELVEQAPVSTADRLAAAKELSILLGLREDKTKITIEDDLIKEIANRRKQVSPD